MLLSMKEEPITPGAALRVLRLEAGLTLDEVASQAGVSATHLSRVETGVKNATPAWIGAVTQTIARHLQGSRTQRQLSA